MSWTQEREILDRLYQAIGEAKKWAGHMADPKRLTMLVQRTDYEHLYDAMELIEGCARQMTAWRDDTRWLGVSRTTGVCLVKLKEWAAPDHLELFTALVDFLGKTEATCRSLETQRVGKIGAILPEVPLIGAPRNHVQVSKPNLVAGPATLQ